jgi:putative transcriptional regulator
MTKLGQDLVESASEALAIANGRASPARTFTFEGVDVVAIRRRLGLSQDKFAKRFNLSPGSVRDWEQGRRRPEGPAIALLKVIEYAPEIVERALNRS